MSHWLQLWRGTLATGGEQAEVFVTAVALGRVRSVAPSGSLRAVLLLPFYHLPIKKWTFKIKLHFNIFILCAVQRGACVEVRGWLSGVVPFSM